MKNNKLNRTHRRLTFMFTWVTFCIIFIIGTSFLFARYFNETRIQKREIQTQASIVIEWFQNKENFLQNYTKRRNIDVPTKFELRNEIGKERSRSGISFFVLDSEDNLVFQEILQQPKFKKLDFDIENIYVDNNTFITTKRLPDRTLIFYQNIRYDLGDVVSDFLLMFLLVCLISGGIYLVWFRFVGSALKPVEENIKDMSDFTHNAGHELKTPLAVVRWNLQIMQAEKKIDTKLIKKSIGQIDEINDIIEWLRELSEVWKIQQKSSIDLPHEVQKIVQNLEPLALKKWVSLHGKFPEKFVIQANKEETDILLINLIKNAILYNKKWGRVDISMKKNVLTISDTGIGMSPGEQEKIFDRLYRAWKSRDATGFGIGLSLVKKIADANNWKLSLKSTTGKGSSFEIIF